MKSFLSALKKYIPVVVVDVVFAACFVILLSLSSHEGVGEYEWISKEALIVVLLLPVCLIIHGVISYLVTRRILLPNLIYWPILWLIFPLCIGELTAYLNLVWLAFSAGAFILSIIGSFLADWVCRPERSRW